MNNEQIIKGVVQAIGLLLACRLSYEIGRSSERIARAKRKHELEKRKRKEIKKDKEV